VPMTLFAEASVCDTDVPAVPVTPEILELARARGGVTVRDMAVAETPRAVAVMV